MLDSFPVPALLRDASTPLANFLHLRTLPLHIHQVLISYFAYTCIDSILSPYLSARLIPATYDKFPRRTKVQWNMHVTAFINATLLSLAALWVIFHDEERSRLGETWEGRIWGYTGIGGMVQALGAGYFLWDVQVCILNLGIGAVGGLDLLHASVGLAISMMGFRPFGLYYGIQYALVELSTPFVNIHWFLNKLNRAGSTLHTLNGIILIVVFACCRLLWGSYLTVVFSRDTWTALQAQEPSWTTYDYAPGQGKPIVMQHQAEWWLAALFMASNSVVMGLSTFWFAKMIKLVATRLGTATSEKKMI
ncbi:hypothetical protein EJ02DRAFT_339826 [Clathrospora elynae]|uniref:TLC domain-containing protein n=1 Tax=Clathrospora elynae TaxID=706981 RepID=A0A6A5SYX9_9PLEO|nr:hypothetical protein EJ02DRAFT_339826 [Clathrospora elynae]